MEDMSMFLIQTDFFVLVLFLFIILINFVFSHSQLRKTKEVTRSLIQLIHNLLMKLSNYLALFEKKLLHNFSEDRSNFSIFDSSA